MPQQLLKLLRAWVLTLQVQLPLQVLQLVVVQLRQHHLPQRTHVGQVLALCQQRQVLAAQQGRTPC
jgi:hypothetical protein